MNIRNLKHKAKYALAVAAVSVLSAPAMADDLLTTATTELGGLKAGILAFGGIVIGIAIALATIRVAKRGINQA
ncbi:major capsid protein [Neisseria sp. ZJ106]|uniref:Major capsid protein n=1 Tax=Neisseria lisongii TaxID=2912188 RepID=A0ABY7RLL8_9NEIS|nr:major capsid protein [Neisseria lisongii]MCF7521959.1 major capsid protein [Neisseria lisongii]WCL71333.1 major capsid protein [Neisseria lisongii]WCL72327.1 major capsid protein [Neisseria lisongii]